MVQRVYLAGLAIGPAIVAQVMPMPALGAQMTFALGGVGSLVGVWASFGRQIGTHPGTKRAMSMLNFGPGGRDTERKDDAAMRAELAVVLSANRDTGLAPQTQAAAVAEVIGGVMDGWGHTGLDSLSRTELNELCLLVRLLLAGPQEAGALAQSFARPDLMLDLRDEVNKVAATRARYDQSQASFSAAQRLWEAQNKGAEGRGLLAVLKGLDTPDPDLWHFVILGHDRMDKAQVEAALWCLEQTSCDRASLAIYLADLAAGQGLQEAARRGDEAYLARIRAVIEGINAGDYPNAELALDPEDAVCGEAARFDACLAELADMTDSPRWPSPFGLFTEYAGRPPGERRHWNLRTGALHAAPKVSGYFPT